MYKIQKLRWKYPTTSTLHFNIRFKKSTRIKKVSSNAIPRTLGISRLTFYKATRQKKTSTFYSLLLIRDIKSRCEFLSALNDARSGARTASIKPNDWIIKRVEFIESHWRWLRAQSVPVTVLWAVNLLSSENGYNYRKYLICWRTFTKF